jgi:hypothetical protein
MLKSKRGRSLLDWQRFLATPEAIKALGASEVFRQRRRVVKEQRRLAREVPSDAWYCAAVHRGEEFPPGASDPPTEHGARMIVSVISGRYTPPQCLESEDVLDAMSQAQALFYSHPPSPSAEAIRFLCVYGGKARPRW